MIEQPMTCIRPDELEVKPLDTYGFRRKRLGRNAASGYVTSLVDVPAGSTTTGPTRLVAWEASVLSGALEGETAAFEVGDHSAGPAASELFSIQSNNQGCSFILGLSAPEAAA